MLETYDVDFTRCEVSLKQTRSGKFCFEGLFVCLLSVKDLLLLVWQISSDSELEGVAKIQTYKLPQMCYSHYPVAKLLPAKNKMIATVSSNIMESIISAIASFVFSHEMCDDKALK